MQKRLFTILILGVLCTNAAFAQLQSKNAYDGIAFITAKFDTHDIVAIGETHDKVEVTDFYIELINQKAFRKKVDFLVIEMGNHLYQDLLDRYILGSKQVEEKQLYQLWRNHTSCMLNGSDNTGMIRLLKAIRKSNLENDHKIRVLAADPDIDWAKVDCLQQFYKHLGNRDEFYTDIVVDHIVKPNKKALIIMGNSHFNKQRTASMIKNNRQNPITALTNLHDSKVFLLNIMYASSFPYEALTKVKKGSVILTNDTWLGQVKVSAPFLKDQTLKAQTDGIIYLGHRNELTKEKITKFNDLQYEQELKRRNNLTNCSD